MAESGKSGESFTRLGIAGAAYAAVLAFAALPQLSHAAEGAVFDFAVAIPLAVGSALVALAPPVENKIIAAVFRIVELALFAGALLFFLTGTHSVFQHVSPSAAARFESISWPVFLVVLVVINVAVLSQERSRSRRRAAAKNMARS